MSDILITPIITLLSLPISVGDIFGFLTGILCVWLTARANILNFPAGILNCIILGVLFYERRLYADASLQIIFILLAVRGWQLWLRGHTTQEHTQEHAPVHRATRRHWLVLIGLTLVLTYTLRHLLLWANGSAPLIDALITSLSLCAQWLLNRRMLDSWYWWITIDLISIPLYWSRGLPLIALLYTLFLTLCISGIFHWRKLVPAGKSTALSAN